MGKRAKLGKEKRTAVGILLCVVMACAVTGICLLVKEDALRFGLPSAEFGGVSGQQHSEGHSGAVGEPQVDGHDQREQELYASAAKVAESYADLFEEASGKSPLMSLETMKLMVARLGENGYAAVDVDNQVDMAGADRVLEFCGQVSAGEEGSLTVVELSYLGGFTEYDMQTEEGKVEIVRSCWQLSGEGPELRSAVRYPADFWEYTHEGYLIFEGSGFAQDYYLLSMGGTPLHTALRVLPLEERCRELNRRYIAPIGYGRNDLFLLDWNEEDFGEIDFYDLYDIFYGISYNRFVPYTAGESAGIGMVYEISAAEFEAVLMTYLDIDEKTLRSKTKYIPERDCYEYRPRGFFDAEHPEVPYPEVVDCLENGDGTLTLTVNAVYPKHNLSKAYTHEVVVRPLADGGVRYVSNRCISSEEDEIGTWHVSRLTEEEWKRAYGEADTVR